MILGMIEPPAIQTTLQAIENPFSYDLGFTFIPSKNPHADIMICCHGFGSSNRIAKIIHSFDVVSDHIIGFNFPDHNLAVRPFDPRKSAFGSIDELLPLLYIMKKCIDAQMNAINLYGFSAGGGAVINALAVLNQNTYDQQLQKLGIGSDDKKKILAAIQKGWIILDCPLKSYEEFMAFQGKSPDLEILAEQYRKNNMRPIDTLTVLAGLAFNIILHFQLPDDVIGNRDDDLYIEQLCAVNKGITEVIVNFDGGHNACHESLWDHYKMVRPILR